MIMDMFQLLHYECELLIYTYYRIRTNMGNTTDGTYVDQLFWMIFAVRIF